MDLARLLEQLQVLADQGDEPIVLYVVCRSGLSHLLTLSGLKGNMPRTEAATPADSVVPLVAGLGEREKAVLRVLERAERPLKGRAVAVRAGLNYTSHFRELMSGLVQAGLVRLTRSRCYWLASRPLTDGDD